MVYKSPAEQVADDYDNIVPVALQEIKERPVVQPPESFLKEWREFNENRRRLE
jgi:hypothetical protein